jgi:hypothetical protein
MATLEFVADNVEVGLWFEELALRQAATRMQAPRELTKRSRVYSAASLEVESLYKGDYHA